LVSNSEKHFKDNRGAGLLAEYYKDSPILAVQTLIDHYDFKPWIFKKVQQGFWRKTDIQKQYLIWLAQRLGYQKHSDWYKITVYSLIKNKGRGLLKQYNDSPIKVVQTLIPEYDFKPWLFNKVPLNYWFDRKNREDYIDWLGAQLNYNRPEDWYKVTNNTFLKNHGQGFLKHVNDSARKAVQERYPNYDWV
jgi:hypothetical protein